MTTDQKQHVPGARVLEELPGGGEDDEGDVSVAEDRELLSLLEEAPTPLQQGHLPGRCVVYPLDLNLLPRHYVYILSINSNSIKLTTRGGNAQQGEKKKTSATTYCLQL